MISYLLNDLRFAVRSYLRTPLFTITVLFTLALGIGATTAIFSVVYSVLIKPLSYPNSEELIRIRHSAPALEIDDLMSSPTMYFTYRDENRSFTNIGIWGDGGETLSDADGTERIRSLRVSHGVLQAIGVKPFRGRWFTEQEHGPDNEGPDPVILSYGFWQSRFGGKEDTLGRNLLVNSRPSQVVGIMPPGFKFLNMTPQADLFVALRLDPARAEIGSFSYQSLARLKPGVSLSEAKADIERMLPIWLDSWPIMSGFSVTREAIKNWNITPVVQPLKNDMVSDVTSALWILMGAVGVVLLVACANIANLMLVRADVRKQQFAVRAALGAVPARIARELFIESLGVGVVGGLLGLVLAYLGLELLVAIGPVNLPRLDEISIHPAVFAFTIAVSLASTIVFGTITVLKHALHVEMISFMSVRGSSTGRERNTTRNVLVIMQVALTLILVVSSVLMIRTFQVLRNVDPGFSIPEAIQTVRTWAPARIMYNPDQFTQIHHEILDTISALPGTTSTGFTSALPMEGPPFVFNQLVVIEGRPLAAEDSPPPRRLKLVSPGYLETMGTRLIAGRNMTWSDIDNGGHVAVISEDFAYEFGAEPGDALGKRIRTPNDGDAWREIIGVVQDVREDALYRDAPSLVYLPVLMENAFGFPMYGSPAIAFVIRSDRTGTASYNREIRQAIWSVNSEIPIALERTMQDLYSNSLTQTTFALVLIAIAGIFALLLGVIGIYGVIAYVVSKRTREIGIRSALGADPGRLKKMFLLHGLTLCGTGTAIGLVVSLATGRLMSSLLYGIGPMDPVAYIVAIVITVFAAAIASYLPARYASSVDPMQALREE